MFVNKYIFMAICLLSSMVSLPADAQRRGRKKPAVPKVTVEQLFQQYKFDEAADLLREKIQKAQKADESTQTLEEDLHRATLGANMLRGTERVLFVDSIKVHRSAFATNIMLSPESGKLSSIESEKQEMSVIPEETGNLAYINELNDRIYFSMRTENNSVKKIVSAYRSRGKWSIPQILPGMELTGTEQDNPFVMPDGVTLYFAAKGEFSLGGYDLFVTRYDPTANQYLKAENLGMPFNSPANDYMLALDETNQLGWLVTDRNQPADSVCIYIFVPNESREIFDASNTDPDLLIRAARISSIDDCRYDEAAVSEARQRLMSLVGKSARPKQRNHYYVINNSLIYTSLDQFRSDAAKRIAMEVDKVKAEIEKLTDKYEDLTFLVAKGTRNAEIDADLREIKVKLPELKAKCKTLCKNMRIAELK